MLQDWQVKLQLQAMACMVRVEGMKAENQYCKIYNRNPAYSEGRFAEEAQQIESIAQEICNR